MLMEDKSRAGACLLITNQRGFEYLPDRKVSYVMPKEKKYIMSSAGPKDASSASRNHLLFPMCFVKCKTAVKHDGTICTVQIDLNQRVNSFMDPTLIP